MRGAVAAVAFGVIALLSANAETWPQPAPDYSALLAVSDRSDADRQADKRRHPATISGFRGRAPRTSTPHRKPSDLRARGARLAPSFSTLHHPAVAIACKCLAQLEVLVWGGQITQRTSFSLARTEGEGVKGYDSDPCSIVEIGGLWRKRDCGATSYCCPPSRACYVDSGDR
jgi:hypothetical protein